MATATLTSCAGGAVGAPSGQPGAPGSVGAGGPAGTLVFGAPLSLTGSLAKEGGLTRDGYDLWKETVNAGGGVAVGPKRYLVAIKYYDDESNAQKSSTLADKLIKEDKVNFLLGPYGTTATLQVSTVAEKNKIPMVEANGAAESIFSQGYRYTFGVLSPAKNYMQGLIEMAAAQSPRPTTVAILSADDSFSVEVAEAARGMAERSGFQVTYFQKYPSNSTELRAPLTEAKSKNPELFLNSGHLAESLAIMQQSKELGFNPKGFGFSVGPSIPDFQTTLKADANFVFGGSQWTADLTYAGEDPFRTPANYDAVYSKRFGYAPSYQSAESTAAGLAFQKAIETAASVDPNAVRDALAKIDFISFFGRLKFDGRGINIYKPMVVEQWQSGKKVTVWPADVATTKPIWPTPAWSAR
ncbi:MAG: amino acid ABC transporter substrate-binding protein [Candidatus Dormibacteraceae bacterium]